MKPLLRLITILSLLLIAVLCLDKNGNGHPLFQVDSPSSEGSLFLPFITLNTNSATTPEGSSPPDAELEPLLLEEKAIPNQYVIAWKLGAKAISASGLVTSSLLAPDLELLDLSDLIDSDKDETARDTLARYQNDPLVEMIEPNYVYTATLIPNDPELGEQWAWGATNSYEAWDIATGDPSVVIAIIDTGIDLNHPDLVDKLVPGYDLVHNDALPTDRNGHGTHVAGTAAAATDNNIGGAGSCPNCAIMPLQALDSDGFGSLNDIAAAVIRAADNDADVINLSLGSPVRSAILRRALNYAWEKGVFVTCAAGNESTDVKQYPAAYDNCVSIAATDESDQPGAFTNFGEWVDYAAPGVNIFSTFPNDDYTVFSGTSMAAPHVAGLAGLLASQGLSNTQIKERICASADVIDGTGELWRCGRINMGNAVRINGTAPTAVPTPGGQGTITPTLTVVATEEPAGTPVPTSTTIPATGTPAVEPTPNPTDIPLATNTPTPTPVPTNTPIYADEIIDGGFENGATGNGTGWAYSNEDIRTTEQPLTGNYSAQLGGEILSSDAIEQDVLVPESGLLGYSLRQSSTVNDWSGDEITLEIEMADDSKVALRLSHGGWGWEWHRFYVDLTPFANKPVSVRFQIEPSIQTDTIFYVDDVAWHSQPK